MWKTININKQNIRSETGKAVLIACPHNSDYDGYCFWHPSKLVRSGRHSNAVSISYTEDFTFYLKKYGKGKYNSREVLDEIQLGYDELEEVFGVMDANISDPEDKKLYETHKPVAVEAVKIETDASLIDDEDYYGSDRYLEDGYEAGYRE